MTPRRGTEERASEAPFAILRTLMNMARESPGEGFENEGMSIDSGGTGSVGLWK